MSEIVKTGYLNSKYNSLQHGILARDAVLAWENRDEYNALVIKLTKQFNPSTPLEQHYLAELVNVMWRKARLKKAEKKTYEGSFDTDSLDKLYQTLSEHESLMAVIETATSIDEISDKIPECIKEHHSYEYYSDDIERFNSHIEREIELIKSNISKRIDTNNAAENGNHFFNNPLHEKLMRYETLLDRKMERILSVLYRLKEM